MKFLDQLPITKEEKELIKALETETPGALYGLIQLTIEAFEKYYGEERTWHLVRHLYPLLTEKDKEFIPSTIFPEDDRAELLRVKSKIKKFINK